MPDRRKTLEQLRQEWLGCRRCVLGERRDESGGRLVFGEGRPGGIFFIGEGPGANEAVEGRPFVGPSGGVLRKAINALGLAECSYISNAVACRSFGPKYDNEGQVMTRKNYKTKQTEIVVADEPPSPQSLNACLSRLYEEIYLVDPILIVSLGGEAAKALLRRSVKVTEKRGTTTPVYIPGNWALPDVTDKGAWVRKKGGQMNFPTSQNYVSYLMFMTVHPAHVLYHRADQSYGNPVQVFIEDMHTITDIYYRYAKEAYGIDAVRRTVLLPNHIIEEE
jgi:uracil-DNA glycosylase